MASEKKYTNTVKVTGLSPTEASPLDDRLLIIDMGNMPEHNDLITYYEDMVVVEANTQKRYAWVESDFGLLPQSYTYSKYTVDISGINYAGRSFNFVLVDDISIFDINVPVGTLRFTIPMEYIPFKLHKNLGAAQISMKSSLSSFTEIEFPASIKEVLDGIEMTIRPATTQLETLKITIS